MSLFPQHTAMLGASGITPDHARARGYVSVDTRKRLEDLGVTRTGRRVPGLLVPQLRADGSVWGYQYRPDVPRVNAAGKPIKYETPQGQRNGIDVPPGVGPQLADPATPLWITEGVKKADAGALAGLCIAALPGVWSWRGSSETGGTVAVPDWHDIALNDRRVVLAFDSDVIVKRSVRAALGALAGYLSSKGARVEYLHLPNNDAAKTGIDDFLADGRDAADLWKLVRPDPPAMVEKLSNALDSPAPPATVQRIGQFDAEPVGLASALATFQRWLHLPDVDPLLAVAAAAVANRSDDASPVWLLMIGPPSGGKTEQIVGLARLPEAVMAATVTESALLSGTSSKERAMNATGGLLRQIGRRGLIVMKDFTSVLSQNRDARGQALSALREMYDGAWDRPVGTDGGKVLAWSGKVGVIAGCTNAYDKHYSVISQLGDRFLIVRLAGDTDDPDAAALSIGMSALSHSEDETVEKRMRGELAAALAGLVAGANRTLTHRTLTEPEKVEIVRLARYAGISRTPVDRDGYTGDLMSVPSPEGPGRLTIAFRQVLGGLEALGVDPSTSWRVIRRLALDTAPAMRTSVLHMLATVTEPTKTSMIGERAGQVTKTASRVLDDLLLIGLVDHSKASAANNSADLWAPTALMLRLWPESKTEMYVPPWRDMPTATTSNPHLVRGQGVGGTSLSHSEATAPTVCGSCGLALSSADLQADTGLCGMCELKAS
jgi:hypothetical protein